MRAKRLTALAVRNEKPRSVRTEVPDLGCRGLHLVIQPSGSKTWAVRFRFGGRSRKVTLGPAIVLNLNEAEPEAPNIGDALTLSAARKLAAAALHQVEQGIDPGEAKARRATAPAAPEIFEVIADEYLNREGKRLRSAEEWRATLKRLVHPTLGARQISEIRRSEIVRLLDRIENERGPVMADSTLAIVRTIMNWHAARSDDFRTPIVRGMARTRPRERARDRVLTDDELRALWPTAEASGQFGAFLRFLLLTGARRNEAARATWGEISDGDWVLPPIRNKTKVELIRPLSDAARRMLDAVKEGAGDKKLGFIFSSDGGVRPLGGFSKSKRAFDKAAGVKNWTLHDLRRTARSLMSRAGVSSDHAERCLGHAIGGVRATYDRHEYYAEKRRAFDALATQIELILHPRKNVLVITGMQA